MSLAEEGGSNHTPARDSAWLQRHQAALANCVQRMHDPRFGPVYVRGSGPRLWDTKGNAYFDLTCGYSANNFGHAFPPLVQALQFAATQLGHLTGDPHLGKVELAEQLLELCGFGLKSEDGLSKCRTTRVGKVVFNSSGGRAIEAAWKAAISFRPGKVITLSPAFHGRTIATSPLSDTPRTRLPIALDIAEVRPKGEYPYCGNCPRPISSPREYPACQIACSRPLLDELQHSADSISAIIVEPALGARGYIFPPSEFMQRLRALTEQHGILMIADEIQTGLGRCGDRLLSLRQGWEADLIVLGKSLGGGLIPISAVVGRSEVLDAIPAGAESETFSGSPLGCSMALAVLQLLADGALYRRADAIGQHLRTWFADHAKRNLCGIQRIEGVGACCVLEFAQLHQRPHASSTTLTPQQSALQLASAMFQQGLLVHHTGPEMTRVVLLPPLTIDDRDIDAILQRTDRALADLASLATSLRGA